MSPLFPVHVDDVAPEGTECVRLRLVARPGDDTLPAFEPGAHVDVMTPSGLIRQYSLCGSADDPSAYLLCIKREADSRGGSQSLCTQVRPGMELQVSVPRNAFSLPAARRYVLVGGGIGVTPLLSMMMRLQMPARTGSMCVSARVRATVDIPPFWIYPTRTRRSCCAGRTDS